MRYAVQVTVLQLSLNSVHPRSVGEKTIGGRSSNQRNVVHANRKRKPRQLSEQVKTCQDEIALIADYLSASLSWPVLRTFEEHLQDCRDCTAFLQTYKKTIEVTRAFLRGASLTNHASRRCGCQTVTATAIDMTACTLF